MTKKNEKKYFFDKIKRSSGILLHPTSLPNKYGIGDLGPEAYKFIDILNKYKLKYWQVLPLGPTGYGNSPYQCFSAFAGNPLLISIEKLVKSTLLKPQEIPKLNSKSKFIVDYGLIIPWKWNLLKKTFENFNSKENHPFQKKFILFKKNNASWLDDYALFMAIKEHLDNAPWSSWPEGLRDKDPVLIEQWLEKNYPQFEFHRFVQFLFFEQWFELKKHCKRKKILIIGDIPIFVALDSADVWANRDLFYIDSTGNPEVIAGVPPDYFSETGQRWGNPLYNWSLHKSQNYKWWKDRFKHILKSVDIVRVDHFRGFEAYWEIPSTEETAINGKWIKGPGSDFFDSLLKTFKDLPVIAENLGIITKNVEELRLKYNFPGMYILQFAFDTKYNANNPYLPHNYSENNVVYTGTHDNDTILGWFSNLTPKVVNNVQEYFSHSLDDIVDVFTRECIKSTAKIVILPLQDILRLDNTARMNFPGKETGNWEWRFGWDMVKPEFFEKLTLYLRLYNRITS